MTIDDAHELARPLRPQVFGKNRPRRIDDPIVEPAWPGVRVLAAVDGGRVTLWEDGEELEDPGGLQEALAEATAGSIDGAILDGYLTKQAISEDVAVRDIVTELPTMKGQMSRLFIGDRRNRIKEVEQLRQAEQAAREFHDDDA